MADRTVPLRSLVFDSLEEQVALVDHAGTIVDVNASWTRFGHENAAAVNACGIGADYLAVVRRAVEAGDSQAGAAARGIEGVLSGASPDFRHEYPCDGPDGKRWFMMRMGPLKGVPERLFVISHADITTRKLAEDRAEYLAGHDPLTGLANRRRFDAVLEGETRRCLRDGSPLSLVLIDVDHFKEYNDRFGHLAGDRCLVEIARTLLDVSRRAGDLAARIGGDEFALVLGGTPLADAQSTADSLGKAIDALGMSAGSNRVTASMGVACVVPGSARTPDRLLLDADRALYRAKSAGRNRVSGASSALDESS
jgi:diguanylate cyclase (GGDEF)-like protein